MKATYVFPTILIVLYFGAGLVCLWQGDYRRAIYWLGAILLTGAVTY